MYISGCRCNFFFPCEKYTQRERERSLAFGKSSLKCHETDVKFPRSRLSLSLQMDTNTYRIQPSSKEKRNLICGHLDSNIYIYPCSCSLSLTSYSCAIYIFPDLPSAIAPVYIVLSILLGERLTIRST